MNILFILLFTLSACVSSAFAQLDKKKILEDIARPLPEDKTFYRWQSLSSGKNLLNHGTLDETLHGYFMGMRYNKDTMVAGQGVYIAENPHSSSRFIRGPGEGSLIEVTMKKGTKYLDMTDPATIQLVKSKGVAVEEVFTLNPEISIKYESESKWWVVKGKESITFKPFEAKGLKTKYLIDLLDKITEPKAKNIYFNILRNVLYERIQSDPDIIKEPRIDTILSKAEQNQAILASIKLDDVTQLHKSIDKFNKYGLFGEYMKEPENRKKFFRSMSKFLDGKAINDVLRNSQGAIRKGMANYLSLNSDPAKYVDYLKNVNSSLTTVEQKLKFGSLEVPNFKSEVSNAAYVEIAKTIGSINLTLPQQEELFNSFSKNKNYGALAAYSLENGNTALSDKILKVWKEASSSTTGMDEFFGLISKPESFLKVYEGSLKFGEYRQKTVTRGIADFLKMSPTDDELLRLLDIAKKGKNKWVVKEAADLLKSTKSADAFVNISKKLGELNTGNMYYTLKSEIDGKAKHLLSLKPKAEQLREFFKIAKKNKWYSITNSAESYLAYAKNGEEFVAYFDDLTAIYIDRDFNKVLKNQMKRFISLKPSSEQVMALIDIAKKRDLFWFPEILNELLVTSKTPDEYTKIIGKFKKWDTLHETIRLAKDAQTAHFLSLKPGPKDIFSFVEAGGATKLTKNFEQLIAMMNTAEEYLNLIEKLSKFNDFGSYRTTLSLAIEKRLPQFIKSDPTPQQVARLSSLAESNWYEVRNKMKAVEASVEALRGSSKSSACNLGLDGALYFLKSKLGFQK